MQEKVARTTVGKWLLLAAVVLLALQFLWAFTRPGTPPNAGFPVSLLGLIPYVLLMISSYLLFSKRAILEGRGRIVRFIIVLLASWAAVGGVFLLLLLLGLSVLGPPAGDLLFSHILWLLPVGMVIAFPLVARYLR